MMGGVKLSKQQGTSTLP